MTIDRADWHYEGDFPLDLPAENGGTHIGIFLAWIINNDLISHRHLVEADVELEEVRNREMTGRDFLFEICGGKFLAEDLSEEGWAFVRDYYLDENGEDYGEYLDDYDDLLGDEYEDLYEIEDSWENYDLMADLLDERYEEWRDALS